MVWTSFVQTNLTGDRINADPETDRLHDVQFRFGRVSLSGFMENDKLDFESGLLTLQGIQPERVTAAVFAGHMGEGDGIDLDYAMRSIISLPPLFEMERLSNVELDFRFERMLVDGLDRVDHETFRINEVGMRNVETRYARALATSTTGKPYLEAHYRLFIDRLRYSKSRGRDIDIDRQGTRMYGSRLYQLLSENCSI